MRKIKLKYVDFWPGFHIEEDLIYEILTQSLNYDVSITDDPDYVIYSCFGKEHLNYDCVRIFFTGEELCPDFNVCDYGIGFEYMNFGDRYFRLPLMYIPRYRKDYNNMMARKYTNQLERGFCSFVYSNQMANSIRTDFYDELSKYKGIASGGKLLNNVGGPVEDKCIFESGYKFSIAFENVRHRGYTTEKIMQSFAAGGIPIYWGDPLVDKMFNDKAFINVSNYDSIEKAIEHIIEIDQNDALYKAMIDEAPLLDGYYLDQVKNHFSLYLNNIFSQDISEAKRTTREMYNKMYTDGIKNKEKLYQMTSSIRKIRHFIKR